MRKPNNFGIIVISPDVKPSHFLFIICKFIVLLKDIKLQSFCTGKKKNSHFFHVVEKQVVTCPYVVAGDSR